MELGTQRDNLTKRSLIKIEVLKATKKEKEIFLVEMHTGDLLTKEARHDYFKGSLSLSQSDKVSL
jgi:hypothetical protein